jgi:hypothetical protein
MQTGIDGLVVYSKLPVDRMEGPRPPRIRAPNPSHTEFISRAQLRSHARNATQSQPKTEIAFLAWGWANAALTTPNLRSQVQNPAEDSGHCNPWGMWPKKRIQQEVRTSFHRCIYPSVYILPEVCVVKIAPRSCEKKRNISKTFCGP